MNTEGLPDQYSFTNQINAATMIIRAIFDKLQNGAMDVPVESYLRIYFRKFGYTSEALAPVK